MKHLIKLLIVLVLIACSSGKNITQNVFKHPIYPNCETVTNKETKKCFSKHITQDILKQFNLNLAKGLNIGKGKKKIMVDILIDKKGKINVISIDAPHIILEQETKRVIELLPLVKAGTLNNLPINVKYQLPITFNIR